MSEQITMQDQIDYLEAYSNMLKSQYDMMQVQIKFLKAGKDMQENFASMANGFPNIFNMMPPFFGKKDEK